MSAAVLFEKIIEKLVEAGLLEPGPLAMMSLTELMDAAELVRKEVVEGAGGMWSRGRLLRLNWSQQKRKRLGSYGIDCAPFTAGQCASSRCKPHSGSKH